MTGAREPSALAAVQAWADTHGAGRDAGAWGVGGAAGVALAYSGTLALMICCPAFAIFM